MAYQKTCFGVDWENTKRKDEWEYSCMICMTFSEKTQAGSSYHWGYLVTTTEQLRAYALSIKPLGSMAPTLSLKNWENEHHAYGHLSASIPISTINFMSQQPHQHYKTIQQLLGNNLYGRCKDSNDIRFAWLENCWGVYVAITSKCYKALCSVL